MLFDPSKGRELAFDLKQNNTMTRRIIFGFVTILAAVVGGLSPFFAERFFGGNKPEIVYSLSNEIYTSLSEDPDREIIQQLTVKNVGEVSAEKLIIFIKKPITRFEIKKYSESDSLTTVRSKSGTEIIYPILPPNGQVDLLIKTVKEGLNKSHIIVKHNSGLGKEIFEKKSSVPFTTWIPMILNGIILFAFILFLINDSYTFTVKMDPIDGILKRSKPWTLSESKWRQLRKDALDNYFKQDQFVSNYQSSKSWNALNSDKPSYLSEDEWQKVLTDAVKNFRVSFFENEILRSYSELSQDVFSIKKPKNLPEKDWRRILDLINQFYFFLRLENWRLFSSKETVKAEYLKEAPELISAAQHEKFKELILNIYTSILIEDSLKYLGLLPADVDDSDLNILDDSHKTKIEKIIEGANKVFENKILHRKLNAIINGSFDDDDLKDLSAESQSALENLNNEISAVLESREDASNDKHKFSKLRTRVEKQLELIDKVLSDPKSIDKFEDYGDFFAKGNMENLRLVADMLKEKKNSGK